MRSSFRSCCNRLSGQHVPNPSKNARSLQTQQIKNPCQTKEFKEFQVEMPWGPVRGKWWGRQDVRPIVAIHGWLDNAGSFDRIIPLLPGHVGYLALDLPGHGRSAHLPAGLYYSTIDFLRTIETVRLKMKWDQVSLMAHSMGSQICFNYSALKPDKVDIYIGIDVLKPLVRKTSRLISDNVKRIDRMMVEDSRLNSTKEPPSYTQEELVDRVVKGSEGSVSAGLAHHLLERAVSPSVVHKNKFFFHRDGRMKMMNYEVTYHELALEMAGRISAPHLFIKATKSDYFEKECYFNETIEALTKSNPLFRYVRADGGHHIHLTEPETVCREISEFICKYRASKTH